MRPMVIDLEASGLQWNSFPISVAWGSDVGAIEYHLIRPEQQWLDEEDAWNPEAVKIHGLTLAQLETEGEPAVVVAQRIADVLNGYKIYSDAPDHDQAWLDRLHVATGVDQTYSLAHIDSLLPRIYHPDHNPHGYSALIRQAFRRSGARRHTADGDVHALLTMLEIAGCQ